ncbi:dihydrolipoyl dehydrogenase family protein [Roseomonas haemaphysalidis]|uniref:FAD-dependent oxidoreductase n=1 Tax=Roseomonas haemaphysalidis TaxID=2768162 RepID=A0ABS3KLG7_9PROT|nr:FAD-dependent oxidoreductase [Roseomonas haemaphysalidis]MBO1078316.1 FAD-dependent oxidoreductase [Roseomonas haemaphysalidis]
MAEHDLVVIGAGSAGLSITHVAARMGLRVALVERERMGGDCLNTGCVPSKALLAAAHAATEARRAGRLGIRLPEPEVDWAAVRAHVQGAIAAIAPQDSEDRYRALGAEVIRAEARFVSPDAVEVAGRRITARRFVVAAGSRAAVPAIPGLEDVPFLTNATLFGMKEKPAHLLILGGGAIGLEMAQAHAALGCRVTVVTSGRLGAREDPELVAVLRDALAEAGVSILEDARVVAAEAGAVLLLADGRRLAGSHLLVAVGRTPNLESLGLEAAGIRATPRGIATDAGLRSTTNRRVFAAGDIADPEGLGPRYLTHVGSLHAGILARRILFRLPAKLDYGALPRVTYTDPELAQVGMTEAEARAADHKVQVLRWPFAENDRAIAEGRTEGLVKLVATPGGRLLGVGIAGRHAGEMIGLWTHAIGARVPLRDLAGLVVPYPTRAEAGKRAAGVPALEQLFSRPARWAARTLGRLPW